MSWTVVRPYFNSVLTARGYTEHTDAFATDNIPATVMDKSFHLGLGPITGLGQNQMDQTTEMAVVLRTYYMGYRTPQEAVDIAIEEAEEILKQLVKVEENAGRTDTAGILNVVLNEVALDPIDASNDNAVVVTSSYTVRIVVAVNE